MWVEWMVVTDRVLVNVTLGGDLGTRPPPRGAPGRGGLSPEACTSRKPCVSKESWISTERGNPSGRALLDRAARATGPADATRGPMDIEGYERRPNGAHQPPPRAAPDDPTARPTTSRWATSRRAARRGAAATSSAPRSPRCSWAPPRWPSPRTVPTATIPTASWRGHHPPGSEVPGVASALQWSVLDDQGEVGYSRATVVGDDGTIYSAVDRAGRADSTAPAAGALDIGRRPGLVADLAVGPVDRRPRRAGRRAAALGTAPSTASVVGFDTVAGFSTDGGGGRRPSCPSTWPRTSRASTSSSAARRSSRATPACSPRSRRAATSTPAALLPTARATSAGRAPPRA